MFYFCNIFFCLVFVSLRPTDDTLLNLSNQVFAISSKSKISIIANYFILYSNVGYVSLVIIRYQYGYILPLSGGGLNVFCWNLNSPQDSLQIMFLCVYVVRQTGIHKPNQFQLPKNKKKVEIRK